MQNKNYSKTVNACFMAYIVQGIINCFLPLLFVTFQKEFNISLEQIAFITTLNFGIQFFIDLITSALADRIGYRAYMIAANTAAAFGLAGLSFIPDLIKNHYAGILICVIIQAIGGGLIEVIVSPLVEACTDKNNEAKMSLLHSFYCWGAAGVVFFSTIFFLIFKTESWRCISLIWSILPAVTAIVFTRVPIAKLVKKGEKELSFKQVASKKIFYVILLLMICSGATEIAIAQWSSAFAETGLGISKAAGDVAGPMAFAVLMGLSRMGYSKLNSKIPLETAMTVCSLLCVIGYLVISLSPAPAVSLAGCCLCGGAVGILWPGTISIAAKEIKGAGTAMFGFLALGGDIGCTLGPTIVGLVSNNTGGKLQNGILSAIFFPATMLIVMIAFSIVKCKKNTKE